MTIKVIRQKAGKRRTRKINRQKFCNLIIKEIMARNTDKIRKGETQKRFDEADNAGRFAGDDVDARLAKRKAIENIKEDPVARRYKHRNDLNRGEENTDAEARRDPAQSHDYKGEAQNVNDDTGRPLNEEEVKHARNKATEGRRRNRNGNETSA
jgi:hypothetical protein